MSTTLFETNPYESHPTLTSTESELLWEYAKLAQHVRQLAATTRQVSEDDIQRRLRLLERKMSLVLTLFKASVWGVINEQAAVDTTM